MCQLSTALNPNHSGWGEKDVLGYVHTLCKVSPNHSHLDGTEYKTPSPRSNLAWSCPKWRTVWRSLLLSERLWHFPAVYNGCFLTAGKKFRILRFYECLWHLAIPCNQHCAFSTRWKAWYTYYYAYFISLECSPLFISWPWFTRFITSIFAVCQQTCWFCDERKLKKKVIQALKPYRAKLTGHGQVRQSKKAPQRQRSAIHMLLYNYSFCVHCSCRCLLCCRSTSGSTSTVVTC